LILESTGRIHATFAWNHVLCKIEVSTAWNVSRTARARAKKCTMSGASHHAAITHAGKPTSDRPFCLKTQLPTDHDGRKIWAQNFPTEWSTVTTDHPAAVPRAALCAVTVKCTLERENGRTSSWRPPKDQRRPGGPPVRNRPYRETNFGPTSG
jgi:hypothetical protein